MQPEFSKASVFAGNQLAGKNSPAVLRHLSFALFISIVLVYLLPGLVGHDPWKQDETYIFGMIHHLLQSGDWVVPMVAGEPFMEKPPLYYWVGAAFAKLFSPWLALHDGARLATGFFMVLTCYALGWSARRWWGDGAGRYAVLALLGCLGVMLHGHLMLTDIPVLTGFAIAACGFALACSCPLVGGLLLGTGVGIGFLAKGVLAPGALGVAAILLPICFRNWRNRMYWQTLGIGLIAALPWLLIWPIALYLRSPSLFMDWFWLNNVGRYFGFSVPLLGAPHSDHFWLETLPWFTFPALPLALVTLWRYRKEWLNQAPIQFALIVYAVVMAVLWTAASARSNYALPLLVPVCLLAAPAAAALSARIDCIFDWSARLWFGGLTACIWIVWILMMVHRAPPDWPFLTRYLPLDFVPHFELQKLLAAIGLTLAAIAVWRYLPQLKGRALIGWVVGLALWWGVLSMLWLPWIDAAKSYRSVFTSMQAALPGSYRCMSSRGLGESERAMLRYVSGINTQRQEINAQANCDVFLIEGRARTPPQDADLQHWKPVWEGTRLGDFNERFWLFVAR